MGVLFVGGVTLGYAALVVARRRAFADGYPTLRRLDWDTLLSGVGSATPGQAALLTTLREGGAPRQEDFEQAGFSGGEVRWLTLLASLVEEPWRVISELSRRPPETVAQLYLREWLALEHEVNPFNLELASFGSKLRINRALRHFGEQPALYFIRARASALLGFNAQVVDDLARAVYFSGQSPFYLRAVTDAPFIGELRPPLMRACREAGAPDNAGEGDADASS